MGHLRAAARRSDRSERPYNHTLEGPREPPPPQPPLLRPGSQCAGAGPRGSLGVAVHPLGTRSAGPLPSGRRHRGASAAPPPGLCRPRAPAQDAGSLGLSGTLVLPVQSARASLSRHGPSLGSAAHAAGATQERPAGEDPEPGVRGGPGEDGQLGREARILARPRYRPVVGAESLITRAKRRPLFRRWAVGPRVALPLKQTRAARDSRAEIKLSNLLIITEGLGSTEEHPLEDLKKYPGRGQLPRVL